MKTLPLGVDIGATRLRIVASVMTESGPRVRAVVTRDLSSGAASSGLVFDCEYLGAVLEEAHEELQTKERRCVLAFGEPDALLRRVEFPRMSALERDRAALFEARRFVDDVAEQRVVRIHPIDEKGHIYALGILRAATLRSRVQGLKAGGLRPVAADHEALALKRALPAYDAILDIGYERSSLHLNGGAVPETLHHAGGGAEITRGIARELAIDSQSAEKRKRILGTLGAGEETRSAFLADIASLLEVASDRSQRFERVGVVGNGARLDSLTSDLERATGLVVETPTSEVLRGELYPLDVMRASAPDLNLAAGLSIWGMGAA